MRIQENIASVVNVYLRTLLFVISIPGSVAVYIPYFLLLSSWEMISFQIGLLIYLGLLPIVLGLFTAGWSIWNFASTGKGSPAMYVDEPRYLVISGPYKLVRNPMYVGVALVLVGEAIFFESTILIIYTIFWALMFHLQVVYHEEPRLRKKFGSQYDEYLKRVPRWIPKLTGS